MDFILLKGRLYHIVPFLYYEHDSSHICTYLHGKDLVSGCYNSQSRKFVSESGDVLDVNKIHCIIPLDTEEDIIKEMKEIVSGWNGKKELISNGYAGSIL
jgi:hypothetical protein